MDYTLSGSVFITFDFVGHHNWPDAPDEVSYLRNMHRHLFKVRVDLSVEHHDREVEYHMAKRRILGELYLMFGKFVDGTQEAELPGVSCESIALQLMDHVRLVYPGRPYYRVEVSEDGENGSVIEARHELE